MERYLFSFIKRKLLYRFIIVYFYDDKVWVHTYDTKNLQVINSEAEEFENEDNQTLSGEIVEHINKAQEQHTRSYVVTTLNSLGQGIIPTCSATSFSDYSIDRRYIYNICVDNLFTNFVSKIEINFLQKLFVKTGIDLIFSPFIILKNLTSDTLASDEVKLHILYTSENATLLITKDGKYIFGSFFKTIEEKELLYTNYEENEEDDDRFEIKDEFEFEFEDDELVFDESEDEIDISDNELDYKQELDLIQNNKLFAYNLNQTLKEFYSKPIYEGSFIDTVNIYSEEKIEEPIIEYIENELFLSVKATKIDFDSELLKLIYKEVL